MIHCLLICNESLWNFHLPALVLPSVYQKNLLLMNIQLFWLVTGKLSSNVAPIKHRILLATGGVLSTPERYSLKRMTHYRHVAEMRFLALSYLMGNSIDLWLSERWVLKGYGNSEPISEIWSLCYHLEIEIDCVCDSDHDKWLLPY